MLEDKTIFIVEDHPILVDGYINLISTIDNNTLNNFIIANNCEEAYFSIEMNKSKKIDFAIIDLNLPCFEKQNLYDGVDIANLIRKYFTKCKIIILSMSSSPLNIYRLLLSSHPEAIIAKSDIDYKNFISIFKKIENGQKYTSPSINISIKKIMDVNLHLDYTDLQIINFIVTGIKNNKIPKILNVSTSTIVKRKAAIKNYFLEDNGSDKELITELKKINLI